MTTTIITTTQLLLANVRILHDFHHINDINDGSIGNWIIRIIVQFLRNLMWVFIWNKICQNKLNFGALDRFVRCQQHTNYTIHSECTDSEEMLRHSVKQIPTLITTERRLKKLCNRINLLVHQSKLLLLISNTIFIRQNTVDLFIQHQYFLKTRISIATTVPIYMITSNWRTSI